PERSARAVEADDVAAGTLSGDERNALTSAHTPLVDKHRDRPGGVRRPCVGPHSQHILPLELRCGFVVVRRVPVELTRGDEEAHHHRHEFVRTARIAPHVDHHALCASPYELSDRTLYHSIWQELR